MTGPRSESRRRKELVGVRLTPAECRDATAAAEVRGVTVPELLRGALHILLASPPPDRPWKAAAYPPAPAWVLTCYGEPVGEYADLEAATTAGEAHILACPQGVMPWATDVKWHHADQLGSYCAAANGEWLNHHLDPKPPAPRQTEPGDPGFG